MYYLHSDSTLRNQPEDGNKDVSQILISRVCIIMAVQHKRQGERKNPLQNRNPIKALETMGCVKWKRAAPCTCGPHSGVGFMLTWVEISVPFMRLALQSVLNESWVYFWLCYSVLIYKAEGFVSSHFIGRCWLLSEPKMNLSDPSIKPSLGWHSIAIQTRREETVSTPTAQHKYWSRSSKKVSEVAQNAKYIVI